MPPRRSDPGAGAPADLVWLGEFGRAVGLRGEVRLKFFTAEPDGVTAYGPLTAQDGRVLELASVRALPAQPGMVVARVKGVSSREGAEALNRVMVGVPRERIPVAQEEDEFLHADLIGLAVFGPDGVKLGSVAGVANFGAGDLLDVRPTAARATVLVPFADPYVIEVDVKGGRVVIAGAHLLDDAPPPDAPSSGARRGR